MVARRERDPQAEEEGTELDGASEDGEGVEFDVPAVEVRTLPVEPAHHGLRLDRFLALRVPEFSRSHLQALVARSRVRVDGQVHAMAAQRLKVGQRVEVRLEPPAHELAFTPEAMPLDVVFEDDDLWVLHKPAGLVVHPAAGNWSGTLLNGLLARDPRAAGLPRAGIVHRLDKDTSGLMVVGRSLEAVTALVRDIAARRVHRQYLALAHGRLDAPLTAIEAPIGRDPRARVRMAVVGGGKPARTDVEELGFDGGISALRCTLHSGRTHQIRVHLAHRGHPLVADTVYGGRAALGLERQALHAVRLAFRHPIHGGAMEFEAAPPPDFAQAWKAVMDESP